MQRWGAVWHGVTGSQGEGHVKQEGSTCKEVGFKQSGGRTLGGISVSTQDGSERAVRTGTRSHA